jgi:hypothetical protein
VFDPENKTKKHDNQASWKRTAMLMFHDDMAAYYSWFIKKRYNLTLNPPLRGAHVTFVNDRASDMNGEWDSVKDKWDGKKVEVELNLDARTDANYWWLNVLPNDELNAIRAELGLGKPFYPFHLTIGYPNNKNEAHAEYIHRMIRNGMIKS